MSLLRRRFLKAYSTTFIVLFSYLSLTFQKKMFGTAWVADKIPETHRRNAKRIEQSILELKGLFIKVGQMLSIMRNFLPDAFTEGLTTLQDAVPPRPYGVVEKRFLEEFGKKPLEIFEKFEETPIASASLGQVHVAYLKGESGKETPPVKVAVKVQYPEIDEIVRRDLKILKRIFTLLHWVFPVYGMRQVYAEIASTVLSELDFHEEAKNLETIQANFSEEKDFYFPRVYHEYSTSKVLTLEFIDGFKVSAVEEMKGQGIDPSEVAKRLIHAYCRQIFIDGIYHADPHPGNVVILPASKQWRQKGSTEDEDDDVEENEIPAGGFQIVLLDFGATARISEKMRKGMTHFAEGLIKRDTRVISQAVREMGFVARDDSFEALDHLVDYFYEQLASVKLDNFRDLNFERLGSMVKLDEMIETGKIKISFRDLMTSFHVPKDWLLLERTLLIIMGLCAHLDPKLNPISIILPYVERFVLQGRTLTQWVTELLKEIGVSYLKLPHELQKTLRRIQEGGLVVRSQDLPQHTRQLYRLGHQLLYGILGMANLFLSVFLEREGFPHSAYASYAALFCGVLFVGSLLRGR